MTSAASDDILICMKKDVKGKTGAVLWVLFMLYCAGMLWLLFLRRPAAVPFGSYAEALRMNLNLVPFKTIRDFLDIIAHVDSRYLTAFALANLIGNVLLFVPFGMLLPALWPAMRKLRHFLPACVLIMAAVEAVQLFTLLGSCDIDDIILNLAGELLGFAFFRLISIFGEKAGEEAREN